jgi:hypothetical protein
MNVGTEKILFIYFNCPTIRTDYIPGNLAFPLHFYDLHCIGNCVGVFVMVAMTLTSLVFTSELKKKECTDCMNILTTESTPDLNGTLCDYIKQCALPND